MPGQVKESAALQRNTEDKVEDREVWGALPAFALSSAYLQIRKLGQEKGAASALCIFFLLAPTFKAPLLLSAAIISVSCLLDRI